MNVYINNETGEKVEYTPTGRCCVCGKAPYMIARNNGNPAELCKKHLYIYAKGIRALAEDIVNTIYKTI